MEIRGKRECTDCGTRWSYYETGSVACPECGSIQSVGVETNRKLHTDSPVQFDLTAVRSLVDDAPFSDVAESAADHAREYVRKRGFVTGGTLQPLDDTYLAVRELAGVAETLDRTMERSNDEEWYFLELLRIADDGDRPAPQAVPDSLRAVRGLSYATAVRSYHRDVSAWLDATDDAPGSAFAMAVLESLRDHTTRIRALDGDVSPDAAERLIEAARLLGAYLRAEDPDGLSAARERLDELVDGTE
jgi:uncharacterized Zn finger protein (UPF0148 family)